MHQFAVLRLIHRALHQFIKPVTRHFRLLPARKHAGYLRQRRDGARSQNRRSDQRAGGHVAAHHHKAAHQQHHHIDDGLHFLRPGEQQPGEKTLLHTDGRGHVVGVIPLILETLFSTQQFNVFNRLHGLDKRSVAHCRFAHPFVRQPRQRALHQQAGDHQQRQRQQNHQHQPAADHPQNKNKQQEEWQIRHRADGGRSDQFPHRFQFADL